MNRLQFDSFYKFIVSLGIILIAAPILFAFYFITNSFDLIFSQAEYEQLSDISINYIEQKQLWLNTIIKLLPYFLIVFLLQDCFLLYLAQENGA